MHLRARDREIVEALELRAAGLLLPRFEVLQNPPGRPTNERFAGDRKTGSSLRISCSRSKSTGRG